MAETMDWITAGDALRIAADRLGAEAAATLVARAAAGAVRTRAAHFTVEVPNACGQKMSFEDELVELPPEFWSTEGRTPVERDWAAGIFSTLVNGSFQHQARGVEFDRAALHALVQQVD